MANPAALTLAFLEKRPSSAAQTLMDMEAPDAAAFLETIPTYYCVAAIAHMSVWSTSAVLKAMTAATAAATLREMDYAYAAAVVRLVDRTVQEAWFAFLPAKLCKDLKTSLSFPSDTVGAKMTTGFLTLTGDHQVSAAIELLQKTRQESASIIYVVDSNRIFKGAVSPTLLLKSMPSEKLEMVADTSVTPLSARARLVSVISVNEWDHYPELPVISRKKILIGSLSRKAARSVTGHDAQQRRNSTSASLISAIANSFFASAVGLCQLLFDINQSPTDSNNKEESL